MALPIRHYIRPNGWTGRLAASLNVPFKSTADAKAALKEWLPEANRKRKHQGQKPLKVGDFKIIQIEPHPYAGSRK
jgi:hypothetical protein